MKTPLPFPAHAALYGILDLGYIRPADAPEMASRLLSGGVQILQLRAKGYSAADIAATAKRILPETRAAEVPLVINDHPEVAAELEADGVHVGQDDSPVADARRAAGGSAFVGKSTHGVGQARAAMLEGPDYIGFGPVFPTPTKPDYGAVGLGDIAAVQEVSTVPVFCIGGIKLENLPAVLEAGARRVAIVSGLLLAPDPAAYARACRKLLDARNSDL